jgi:tungstate transport system ATP-binding protein
MSVLAEVEHVAKSFGQVKALYDVTLKVRKGEVFSLVGPNGSGKTTLLRILACLENPDRGRVSIGGERVDDRNRNKVKIGVTLVFQKTTLFTTSVYNNVAYGLKFRGTPKGEADEAVKRALEMVKLEGFERRHAKKLSGGEQQRVSLARGLALDTPLLLLDEPTANLDPKSASVIEEVVREVNRQRGTTVVVATHNVLQVGQIAGRAAMLVEGRVTDIGSVDEVLGRSRSFAGFARLENIFSGVSEVLEEGTSRVTLDGGFLIESALRQSGRVTVFVRPEDIVVSKKRFESSARNVFEGKIVEVSDLGALLRLKIDAGRVFMVQVTRRSFVEMGLNVGSTVFLTFKASSVQLI